MGWRSASVYLLRDDGPLRSVSDGVIREMMLLSSVFIDADTEMVHVGDGAATECESDSYKTSQAKFLEDSPDTPACGMWTIS